MLDPKNLLAIPTVLHGELLFLDPGMNPWATKLGLPMALAQGKIFDSGSDSMKLRSLKGINLNRHSCQCMGNVNRRQTPSHLKVIAQISLQFSIVLPVMQYC